MEYMRAFNFLFEHPNWVNILLFVAICMLIPVVGPLLLIGYQFVVVEALIRGNGKDFPEFDFGKFGDYLLRGLWPWLAALIVQLVFAIPIWMVMFFGMMCFMGIVGGSGDGGIAALGMLAFMVFIFVFAIAANLLLMLVSTPMVIRAGLTQELGEAFNFGWAKDFIARTWKEALLFYLFLTVGGMVLGLVGLMVFCVGVYIAAGIIILAQSQLYYQLYQLYLARGGEALVLKEPTA